MQNFRNTFLTSIDSRGFEWHKRVSNLVGTDVGSFLNLLYIYYNSYTSATGFGHDGKKGKITSKLWCNSP